MPLENEWIGYITRTYQQIKDNVLTLKQALVPEITDHTESNPFVRMVGIWSGAIEMLGYYVDNAAREAHLSTARLYWSGIKHAKAYDYRVHSHVPSTGAVTFIINQTHTSPITIPANTELQNDDGVLFYTTETVQIAIGQTEVTVGVRQATSTILPVVLGFSDGSPSQEFVVPNDCVDGSVALTVASFSWTGQETLGYSIPTDQHFVQSVNELKQTIVRFGDGVAGAIPANGDAIEAIYETTLGEAGNTGAYTITTINSTISLPSGFTITCENRIRTSGGRGVETLDELKEQIPKSIRTQLRAVTDLDFTDLPTQNAGVAKAGFIFDCGKEVQIYIVPDGGGIAGPPLLASTQAWMETFRILLVGIEVLAAGEVNLTLVIDLTVLPQYSRVDVTQAVEDNLTTFLSVANQDIRGKVYLSDLYEVIETTEGVSNSNIKVLKAVPFARILTGTNTLNWTRETADSNATTQAWTIKIVGATTYELIRGTTFIGVFNFGATVSLTEIEFNVSASSYNIGDSWEFYTYPSFVGVSYGVLDIVGPNLPVSLPSDITINATGGI